MQSIDSIETYAQGANKDAVSEKEKIKCYNIIKQCEKKKHFDDVIKENIKEHNPNSPEIPDYPYGILIAAGSESGKTNALLTLIKHEPYIDKNIFIC